MSKKSLQESIESEMSGHLQELLVAVGESGRPLRAENVSGTKADAVCFLSCSEVCEERSCVFR